MEDFLFHKVSEEEKEVIKNQAKDIIDSFSKELSKVELIEDEPILEREVSARFEGEETEEFSKELMFSNAPNKNKDFLIAETKKW